MPVTGIRTLGGDVEMLDEDEPLQLAPDEVLINVRSAGVGNWDNIVRYDGTQLGHLAALAHDVADHRASGVVITKDTRN